MITKNELDTLELVCAKLAEARFLANNTGPMGDKLFKKIKDAHVEATTLWNKEKLNVDHMAQLSDN